ncbi:MAG: AMP-binding protein, partial [Alphaproteobacteria bacterium]|nr:AMP-binding protein [Alphaproteobacteria bacterium]
MNANLFARLEARIADPARIAIELPDGTPISYGALRARTARIANRLKALGLQTGDRVAVQVEKSVDALALYPATVRAGGVFLPLNTAYTLAELEYFIGDAGPRIVVCDPSREAGLKPVAAKLGGTVATLGADGSGSLLAGIEALPGDFATEPRNGDDLAAILYTSGSTGRPKGVMLSHANLWLGAESVATYLKIVPGDRVLAVLPLSFDYGQNQLLSSWYAGASVAPLDYLTARDVVKAVARHRVTTLAGVPPLWVQLVESNWPAGTAALLRRLANSGRALTP